MIYWFEQAIKIQHCGPLNVHSKSGTRKRPLIYKKAWLKANFFVAYENEVKNKVSI